MAGIWNVNSTYNVNNKKIATKLSFEIGQKFSARVVNIARDTQSILLKLLDGWQFSADIENPDKILLEQLLRFQVEGFEDGKLKLKIVSGEGDSQNIYKDAIENFINEKSVNLSKEDYGLIDEMVKHEIPLTKDNISNVKTIVEFMDKLKNNPNEKQDFIQKYLQSKEIHPESSEAKKITGTLNDFFREFSKMSSKDVFTFIENNIDLNSSNIKSFNNVFKEPFTIYHELEKLAQTINQGNALETGQKPVNDKFRLHYNNTMDTTKPQGKLLDIYNSKPKGKNEYIDILQKNMENAYKNTDSSEIAAARESIKEAHLSNPKDGTTAKNLENTSENTANTNENKILNNTKNNDSNGILKNIFKESIFKDSRDVFSRQQIDNIADDVKQQLNSKTREMADMINQVINGTNDSESSQKYDNVMKFLNNNMNDFKMFNTVSNSYYYMDLPLKFQERDYGFRLMIKDDRKKGKKIDTANVKIATSISTNNMGTIDAYLTVKDNNMDIDIKSIKNWVGILQKHSKKILESLSDLSYNINVRFHEKYEEMNISSCREFFQDKDFGTIDTRV